MALQGHIARLQLLTYLLRLETIHNPLSANHFLEIYLTMTASRKGDLTPAFHGHIFRTVRVGAATIHTIHLGRSAMDELSNSMFSFSASTSIKGGQERGLSRVDFLSSLEHPRRPFLRNLLTHHIRQFHFHVPIVQPLERSFTVYREQIGEYGSAECIEI